MKVVVTGGAGFIGCRVAEHYARKGAEVSVLDNLSRHGTKANAEWLQRHYPVRFLKADIRHDQSLLEEVMTAADLVFHMAAQVAVTTSVEDPRGDFEVNALGTLNVLEAVRRSSPNAVTIYASTNKVYGKMEDARVVERGSRYEYDALPHGVGEERALDFYSPYGCSKGCGDQYVRDYARIYGLKTIVFRQSCIYGERQFGMEDQGWVAWFTIAALAGRPLTIYGDGKQVRDVLHIADLIRAYELSVQNIERTCGRIYNMGGGPAFTLSLLELIALLEERLGKKILPRFADWRPGDQRVYVSDIRQAKADFGWEPLISPREGVEKLIAWVEEHWHLFEGSSPSQAAKA